MLARNVTRLPSGPDWLYEIKWDGYRVEAIKQGDTVRLLSRKGIDLATDFPTVVEAVKRLPAEEAVVDGEVVALDPGGHPSFQMLQHRASGEGIIVDYVFDLLHLDGTDWTHRPLEERRARLAELVAGTDLRFSASLEGTGERIVPEIRKLGLEGVVAKRRHSTYESGERSGAWQKFKMSPEQEFVIGGFKPGTPLESLVVGYYDQGRFICAGKVRQGLDSRNRKELFERLKSHKTAKCPFANLPNARKSHWGEGITAEQMSELRWAKPVVVAQIAFTEWTRGGNLRHGEYKGLREDKRPRDVHREALP